MSSGPPDTIYDLAIIGGGINGCGIARDAAGRGVSVYLCEADDLASATSSASTKLIHGGLRYLEHYEFRLVREALIEREVLWGIAPHIVRPMRFVLPHTRDLRPAWMLRLGLFLYDHLGGRERLPGTRRLDLRRDEAGEPLALGKFTTGFEYSDCAVDDARLVVLNAIDAREHGAVVETRTRAVSARREGGLWELVVQRAGVPTAKRIRARALVNAAGPWIASVLGHIGVHSAARVRLVQGSHIVVRKLYAHDRAYILQNTDGRIVFSIPWLDDFTMIGTTDRDFAGDAREARASEAEVAYLCEAVARYFARAPKPADVVWSFAGVRALYDDGASEAKAATRDYVLELDGGNDAEGGRAPLLSVFGGKITTYRRLAEHALEKLGAALAPELAEAIAAKAGWTAKSPLPGGDFPIGAHTDVEARLAAAHPYLAADVVRRLVAAYGTRAADVLGDARSMADLGRPLGAGLTEAEVRYLMRQEWAETAEDIFWRRTKLGLRLTDRDLAWLDAWMSTLRARSA